MKLCLLFFAICTSCLLLAACSSNVEKNIGQSDDSVDVILPSVTENPSQAEIPGDNSVKQKIYKDSAEEAMFEQRVSLNGKWDFVRGNFVGSGLYRDDLDWEKHLEGVEKIEVPANWQTQGIDHHGVAWYRTEFNVDNVGLGELNQERDEDLDSHNKESNRFKSDYFGLRFSGVDYLADVWLNGEYLGFHEGYFETFEFDASRSVRRGKNVLVVKVDSPLEKPGKSWSLHKRLIKGVLSHHDTRPGGAWSSRGQEWNSGGIWNDVDLVFCRKACIRSIEFNASVKDYLSVIETSQDFSLKRPVQSLSSALISVEVDNLYHDNKSYTFRWGISDQESEWYEKSFDLEPGKNTVTLSLPEKIRSLWVPWELGLPSLYDLSLNIMDSDKKIIARHSEKVGFREYRIDKGTRQWRVNGVPFFVRGTNYIPTHWLSNMSKEDYVRDLELMRDANINAVRVHAHVLPKVFYSLADQMGFYVWQDFPLQWGYVDDESLKKEAVRQSIAMVQQYYNHPSIAVWSAHNEPPWDASWMVYKYDDYDEKQNKQLDIALHKAIKKHDSTRHAHMASLTGEHPWLGWYSGVWQDYARPTEEAWITEFGAQALPNKDVLVSIVGKENLWPKNDQQWKVWEYHNFQRRETFEIAKVDQGKTVDGLIFNSQDYQRLLTNFAAESYRRQKGDPVNAIFQFMFVENWPSMNWGILDFKRNPKPAYESLKRAYQPLLPIVEFTSKDGDSSPELKLWLVNDYNQRFSKTEAILTLIDEKKSVVEKRRFVLDIPASSVENIAEKFIVSELADGNYSIDFAVYSRDKILLSRNHYDFSVNYQKSNISEGLVSQ